MRLLLSCNMLWYFFHILWRMAINRNRNNSIFNHSLKHISTWKLLFQLYVSQNLIFYFLKIPYFFIYQYFYLTFINSFRQSIYIHSPFYFRLIYQYLFIYIRQFPLQKKAFPYKAYGKKFLTTCLQFSFWRNRKTRFDFGTQFINSTKKKKARHLVGIISPRQYSCPRSPSCSILKFSFPRTEK